MKLTKDDFTSFDLGGEEYFQWSGKKEERDQILKNHEDAEKWNEMFNELCKWLDIEKIDWKQGDIDWKEFVQNISKRHDIVERLKKRIEENNKTGAVVMLGTSEWSLDNELQEILGEKI